MWDERRQKATSKRGGMRAQHCSREKFYVSQVKIESFFFLSRIHFSLTSRLSVALAKDLRCSDDGASLSNSFRRKSSSLSSFFSVALQFEYFSRFVFDSIWMSSCFFFWCFESKCGSHDSEALSLTGNSFRRLLEISMMSSQGSERHLYLTVLEISNRNKSQSNAVTSKMLHGSCQLIMSLMVHSSNTHSLYIGRRKKNRFSFRFCVLCHQLQ